MGLSIGRIDKPGQEPPFDLEIVVTCDGKHEKRKVPARFVIKPGMYPRDPPYKAGWRFKDDGRVLCPSCSE